MVEHHPPAVGFHAYRVIRCRTGADDPRFQGHILEHLISLPCRNGGGEGIEVEARACAASTVTPSSASSDQSVGVLRSFSGMRCQPRGSVARVAGVDPRQVAMELQSLDLNIDPWISRATPHLATGRVFNTEDLLPNAQMRRTDVYNAYYRQFGVEQQVAAVDHRHGNAVVKIGGQAVNVRACRRPGRTHMQ